MFITYINMTHTPHSPYILIIIIRPLVTTFTNKAVFGILNNFETNLLCLHTFVIIMFANDSLEKLSQWCSSRYELTYLTNYPTIWICISSITFHVPHFLWTLIPVKSFALCIYGKYMKYYKGKKNMFVTIVNMTHTSIKSTHAYHGKSKYIHNSIVFIYWHTSMQQLTAIGRLWMNHSLTNIFYNIFFTGRIVNSNPKEYVCYIY